MVQLASPLFAKTGTDSSRSPLRLLLLTIMLSRLVRFCQEGGSEPAFYERMVRGHLAACQCPVVV